MKFTFKHLVDAYKEYESIQSSYKGEKTDWYEVHLRLYNLKKSLNWEMAQSNNFSFNLFIKRSLMSLFEKEYNRITIIIDELEKRDREKMELNKRFCPKCGNRLSFSRKRINGISKYVCECEYCQYQPKCEAGVSLEEAVWYFDAWLNL